MPRTARAALVFCLSIIAARPSAAQTVEEVVDKLMEAQKSVGSYSIKMKTQENLVSILGRVQTRGTYSYEWVRQGDGFIFRQETTFLTEDQTAEGVKKSSLKGVAVCDGEFIFSVTEIDGQVSASKINTEITSPLDARKQFASLAEYKKMKVLPDEKVADRDCYVIEELNTGEFASFEKGSVSYYCKQTGIELKSIDHNLAGEVIRERVVTEVKVNEDIPKERFEFKPPSGVKVEEINLENDD